MAAADCCPQPAEPAQPAQPAEPAGGEEAKAKAAEMKGKEAEAKAKAQKEGKPVDGESPIKPTPVSVPPVPKSQAKPGGAAPPTQTAAKKPDAPQPKQAQGQKSSGDPGGASGAGGSGAAGAASASVDAEVKTYLDKAPHQPDQISPQVKELVSSAKNLKANAPPPGGGEGGGGGLLGKVGDTLGGAAKMMLPGADSLLEKDAKDTDLGKMMGKGDNPYKDFNSGLGKTAAWLTRIRDFLSGASSILGKIGLVLTIIGVIISLTGIGAALGGPIATIGRVLGIITLVLDAVCACLSMALVIIGGIMFKNEPDPAKRQKLAKQLISDANNTFSSLLSVAMAVPGLKKLAGVAAKGLKGIATGIITKIATKLGLKAGMTVLKNIGKQILSIAGKGVSKIGQGLSKVGSKLKGLFKGGGEPGMLSKLMAPLKEKAGKLASGAWTGVKGAATSLKDAGKNAWKKGGEIVDSIKNKFKSAPKTEPGFFDKVKYTKGYKWMADKGGALKDLAGKGWTNVKDKAGKGWEWVDKKSEAWEKGFNKATGGEWVENNVQNRMDYYLNKWSGKPTGWAERTGEALEKKAQGLAPKEATDDAARQESKTAATTAANTQTPDTKSQVPQTPPKPADPATTAANTQVEPATPVNKTQPEPPPPATTAANTQTPDTKSQVPQTPPKPADPATTAANTQVNKPQPANNSQYNPEEAAKKSEELKGAQTKAQTATDKAEEDLKAAKKKGDAKEIADAENALKEQEAKLDEAKEKVTDEEANQRAQQRIDQARGNRAKDSNSQDTWKKEFQDSKHYRDPEKYKTINKEGTPELTKQDAMEKTWTAYSEGKENKERQDEYDKEFKEKGANYNAESVAEHASEFAEHHEHESGEPGGEHPSGEPGTEGPASAPPAVSSGSEEHGESSTEGPSAPDSGSGAAPPTIAALTSDSSGGELSQRVHGMLGNLDDDEADHEQQDPEHKQQDAQSDTPQQPTTPADQSSAPPTDSGTTNSPDGGANKEGPPGAPGAVPYWPGLLEDYKKDLSDLAATKQELQDYKKAQLEGYKKAVGIKDDAQKQKETAEGRKPSQAQNTADAQGDIAEFQRSGGQAGQMQGESQKGAAKKNEGQAGAQEGGSAASVSVPDPPAPHWWDRIINAIKSFLVNYVGKGLQYLQNAFTNFILKKFVGVDLDSLNKCANCSQQKTQEGATDAQGAQQQTKQSEDQDNKTKAKAEESMSDAQQLQAKTKENIASADELLEAIGKIEGLLQQEIAAGNEYMANLAKSKQEAQAEEEAKEQAEQKKEQEAEAKKQKEKELADKAAAEKGNSDKNSHKDEPPPEKVAKVREAAQLVASNSTSYHARLMTGHDAARAALSGQKGSSTQTEQAIRIFDESAKEHIERHQKSATERSSKMQSFASKSLSKSEMKETASQIESEASAADSDMQSALEAIKSTFDTCYTELHSAKKGHRNQRHRGGGNHPQHGQPPRPRHYDDFA
jgi:hypothetical protein